MASLFSKTISLKKEFTIEPEEFKQLRDFIYAKSGIYIADNRKYLLENRLRNRLKHLNLKSFGEYYYYLQYDSSKSQELNKLFEVVTTNETSFYRNPPQLKVFQKNVLGALVEHQRKAKDKRIRIWSAGCSTGEEPYTMALQLHEVLGNEIGSWNIRITANDLSEGVLASARRGVYTEYALRTTPPELVKKYFIQEEGRYKVKPELKKLITFGQINLSDRMQLKRIERSHIIFCRNVIIYFDDEMKRNVIGSFYDNLLPGGYLLIGHSESLHNISRAFKPTHFPGAIIYRKEE
ncbi:CheR family methyltransferase [Desulfovibrio ferrophilus]|uniref:protein-glutamate O-methyltransferase n=1 Tax=Desulfovibrio ferrophilus TaxID=241368 RepID=A0A2Z6AVE0_9BACT|nr:protein-glutamate O-methyltransferase CheR [Desulfovibrio ferrophilus]BBD07212.1 chemotaxis protein CheR [Desulfovibrio ferrophilus]